MSNCALVVLLVSMATSSYAVPLGLCDTSADCTVYDSRYYCQRIFTPASCTLGSCSFTASAIKQYGHFCTQTDICESGLKCASRVCVCKYSSYTYRPAIAFCLDQGQKVYGEACTNSWQCYNSLLNASGMICSNTCQCATGYVYRSGFCDIPHVGEACAASPGCRNMTMPLDSDTSRRTETCISGTCSCPSNSIQYTKFWDGTSYSYCLATTTATLKPDGIECNFHNECASKICAVCPTDLTLTKRCLRLATSDVSGVSGIQATTGVILTLFALKVTLI